MNDVNHYLQLAEKKMNEAADYLEDALAHIRAGKANVKILDGIRVDAYGSKMPLNNVANVACPDARTIAITPWDKSTTRPAAARAAKASSRASRRCASTA